VGAGANLPLFQGQSWLGALQGLALAFLITAQHHRAHGRIQIKSDDIPELQFKFGIVGKLERAGAMGFEVVGSPQALHRILGEPDMPCHAPARPPAEFFGGCTTSLKARRAFSAFEGGGASRAGGLRQPGQSKSTKRCRQSPAVTVLVFNAAAISSLSRPCAASDTIRAAADDFLRGRRSPDQPLQFAALLGRQFQR